MNGRAGPYRIGIVVSNLKPGGAERQMLALARGLPRDRFAVEFVALAGPGIWDERATEAGIPVHYAGSESLLGRPLPIRYVGRLAKAMAFIRIARARRYDAIDAWIHPNDTMAALLRPLHRAPVVVQGHRDVQPHASLGPVGRLLQTATARLADASVANAEAVARVAVRERFVPPSKLHVIRNGLEPIPPMSAQERTNVRERLGVGPHEIVLATVAQLREVKRHELLVDAFSEAARGRPDARLLFIGDGPMRGSIERSIAEIGMADRIRILGTMPEGRALVGGVDVVVQAAIGEGLPNALLEAAAAGRAILATDSGGTSEVVIDGTTGLLVPMEDRKAMAEGMARLIDDPGLRERLGSAARAHVERTFGMERFLRDWEDLYAGLIESKRSDRRHRVPTRP